MNNIPFALKGKDRRFLKKMTKTGLRPAKEFGRACLLLALDKGKKYSEIEDFYDVSRITIWRVKRKYLESGVMEALKEEARPGQPVKYQDKEISEIVALACSKAPEGHARWTLRLLEKELKARNGWETINRESIRLVLKKKEIILDKKRMIPDENHVRRKNGAR